MIWAEQAVMGEAEGLRHEDRVGIRARPYLTQYRHDRFMLTTAVISFRCQPGTNPKRERGIALKQRKDMLKPGFQLGRAGNRPLLAYPQPR